MGVLLANGCAAHGGKVWVESVHRLIDEGGGGGKQVEIYCFEGYVCVERRDNFVLGSFITSSESLNESLCSITHGRGLQ